MAEEKGKSEKKQDETQDKKKEEKKKETTHIPLRFIRNDNDELEEDMKEIFDEDKVTHRQGSSEPEAD
ncbi:MAG: hypothetical protein MPW14_04145 [Candidatus Manganitrophus sp.]|nr:hypothetical protein [Candidatus Manganitrophus morganii]MDC4203399.1 hypothetical protein [Candidatus Manganitrophus sp.]MDC4225076.1 hypothetical protein [Candidatus Manganitrophus sp.]WDT71667.1 MAG: hypothetical protein MPW17_02125 [Candidatus Manganitrophus sp.]WDT80980.1 MAG: hypothetical protein MPW14_04145 [Candidatus Manganitrophus sp.]